MHTYTPRSTRLTAILFVPVIAVLCLPALGANSVPFSDGFDVSDGHTAGNPVTQNAAKGWKATSTAPKVTSAFSYEGGQSAYVPQDEAITNEISTAVQKVWTRFFTRAKLYDGVAANRPTNGLPAATVLFFFSSNGYVVVRSGESWVEKTQDVAGNPMFKVSSNLWTKVDVFSDYSQSKWSLFLTSNITSRLVVDAVPFWRSSSGYTFFAARDDVYVDELSVATTP
ncbi:MAG: hypothetical protein N2255_04205, partial [Kiritimatiellae bacterium]|nr:hypothetical protein [Kiritimatiellia bacterium]